MQLFANNADSELNGAIASNTLSLTLKAGEGAKFPSPTGGDFFLVTLYQKVGATETNHEIVKCTARSGDVLTVVRAQEGTTARAFSNATPVDLRSTAGTLASKADVASAYVHPASHPPSIITQDASNRFVTDVEKAAWNAKQAAGTYATGTGSATGTNTGDNAVNSLYSGLVNYTHPVNHPASIITQDSSNRFVTDAEKTTWNAKGVGDVTLTDTQTLTNKTIHGNTNTLTVDGTNSVGYKTIPQLDKTTAYTLVLGDAGKHVHKGDTTAFTVTIPDNSSVAFPIGTAITFVNSAASGAMTIAITTDTMRLAGAGTTGSRTLEAYGVATAIKVASTTWQISGVNLT